MTDFKAKMHQIWFRLGLRPRHRWGAYSAPQTPLLDFGAASRQGGGAELGKRRERGRGRGGRGKWRAGKGRAPKLLLNQGPSENCYAAVWLLNSESFQFPSLNNKCSKCRLCARTHACCQSLPSLTNDYVTVGRFALIPGLWRMEGLGRGGGGWDGVGHVGGRD